MRRQNPGSFVGFIIAALVGGSCSASGKLRAADAAGAGHDGAALSDAGDAPSRGDFACTVETVSLGRSPLALSPALEVSSTSDGFFLSALDDGGPVEPVSFAHAGQDGVVGDVTRTEILNHDCGLAGITNTHPGDQLIACSQAGRDTPADFLTHFVVTPLDRGALTPGPAAPLFAASVINQNRVFDMASSFDGRRSIVAIGSAVVGQPVAALVGPGGTVLGTPLTIAIADPQLIWESLRVVPTLHGGATSLVDGNVQPIWHVVELDSAGMVVLDARASLPALSSGASIRAVAPTVRGFAALLVGDGGQGTIVEVDRADPAANPPRMLTFALPDPVFPLGIVSQTTDEVLVALRSGQPPAMTLSFLLVDSLGISARADIPLPGVDSGPTWIPGDGKAMSFFSGAGGERSMVRVNCSR